MAPTVTCLIKRVEWRWIESGAGSPAWNMAVDEALLDELEERGGSPVFRVYRWAPAALSLGRFQPAADVTPPAGATLVRRLTGGAAIHHRSDELTYSVVAPYAVLGGRPRAAYAAIHELLRAALTGLGVPLAERSSAAAPATTRGMCFDAATGYDLVAGDKKLVGSAQRRRGKTFLQHGSLPRTPDPLAKGAVILAELVAAPPSLPELTAAIRSELERRLAAGVVADALRNAERARAMGLERSRYAAPEWTLER